MCTFVCMSCFHFIFFFFFLHLCATACACVTTQQPKHNTQTTQKPRQCLFATSKTQHTHKHTQLTFCFLPFFMPRPLPVTQTKGWVSACAHTTRRALRPSTTHGNPRQPTTAAPTTLKQSIKSANKKTRHHHLCAMSTSGHTVTNHMMRCKHGRFQLTHCRNAMDAGQALGHLPAARGRAGHKPATAQESEQNC